MDKKPENGKKIPLYIKIAGIMCEDIKRGDILPGEKLSQRSIALRLGISKNTVSEAFSILYAEGLLITKNKIGTFVNDRTWLPLIDSGTPPWTDYIKSADSVPSEDDKYSIMFKVISSDSRYRLAGMTISKDFNFARPVRIGMERALLRIRDTADLYSVNIAGMPSLRKSLSEHMARCGIKCGENEILVTSGPLEALNIVFASLLRRGMKVFYEKASILGSPTFAKSIGADMQGIPTDDDGIIVDEFIDSLRKTNANAVLHLSPVNQYPSGASMTRARRDALAAACASKNIPIVEYDMLRDINLEGKNPRPLKSFDIGEQVVYIGSFLSGYQNMKLGWITAPPAVLKHLIDIKTQFDINTNTMTQIVADEMLTSGAYTEYIADYTPFFRERITFCRILFEKYFSGIASWSEKPFGFYQWLEFKKPVNTFAVLKELQKTFVHSGYFFDKTGFSRFYISPVADSAENLEKGLCEIRKSVEKLYNI